MKSKRILHVGKCDKFLPPFIEVINQHFEADEHEFLLKSGMSNNDIKNFDNVCLAGLNRLSELRYYFKLIIKLHLADKVILHSLLDIRTVQILFFTPWLLSKCHWVIWGADLYTYKPSIQSWKWKFKERLRKRVISNVGYLVTYVKGDVRFARKWYGAKGEFIECIMYPSNFYKDYTGYNKMDTVINIQIGNSADSSNNHIEAFEKLLPYKNENIRIFVPLSYGSEKYAQKVIVQGEKWFGDKFKPLTKFMTFENYLSFLGSIDIAIFNHKRQQAMGNTITLLGLGKTVYIRSQTTQWEFLKSKNIAIKDVEKFNSLEVENNEENVLLIKKYFSKENCIKQLEVMFSRF